jgi:hypothetical protein
MATSSCDTASWTIYGPRPAGAWSSGTYWIGPQGNQGTQGTTGDRGFQGDQELKAIAVSKDIKGRKDEELS